MTWTFKSYLERVGVTPYKLAKESGLPLGTVYPLTRGDNRRVDLSTLDAVLAALDRLTGQRVEISDVLRRERE